MLLKGPSARLSEPIPEQNEEELEYCTMNAYIVFGAVRRLMVSSANRICCLLSESFLLMAVGGIVSMELLVSAAFSFGPVDSNSPVNQGIDARRQRE